MNKLSLLAAATIVLTACSEQTKTEEKSNTNEKVNIELKAYPDVRKDSVVDEYYGTVVEDPYRWLEDDTSAETAEWVNAQNEVTFDYLSQIPYRNQIEERLTTLWNYEKLGSPFKHGPYYFMYKNDGIQNQSVLFYQEGLDGEQEVLLDPEYAFR